MTREEQTDWLCRLRADLNNGVIFTPWNKEFTEALTGILEQEPCEDAISRADARHLIAETNRNGLGYISTKVFKILYDGIDNLPSVTPQPKMGRWIDSHIPESMLCECSECGFTCGAYSFNYCPNCGARMEEE